jgi:HPt (histidine-containing phosphotransfer) domain-containing protein
MSKAEKSDATPNPELRTLAPIPGVDTARGIAMTGGKEVFYHRVLDLYQKDAYERLPNLQTVPEADAMNNFITHVHSLKSASGSIGAAGLSAEAAALEAAGKAGNLAFIKDNLPGFAKHLTELAENIRAALGSAQVSRLESSSLIAHRPLLIDLQAALKSKNAVEIDRITDELNQKQLDPGIKETLEKISDDVLMTEFDDALKSIEELLHTDK